jgi:endonuclease YncB( thermonuclease family)
MVESGWAVSYGRDYEREEARARGRSLGLWAGEFERPQAWQRQNARRS